MAPWPLCGWNCLLLYTILNEGGARKMYFGAQKGAAFQRILDRTSFFHMEK